MKGDCPNAHALQSLLDETEVDGGEAVLGHLETCTVCQSSLQTLAGDAAAWRSTASGLAATARFEPALLHVVQRLKDEDFLAADEDDLSFLQSTDKPDLLGLLGDYEIHEQIGRGGMGIVLKANEPALGRVVAIKVLAPKLASSVSARRRFVREGRAAAKVVHDNIVTVYGVQETEGIPYLIMQHVEGESLQQRLDRAGPLPLIDIVRIGQQAAAGLAAAHAHGLIHRDIKPANLLLETPRNFLPTGPSEAAERVKITDFGLARMADDVQMTQHGMVLGTPEYMSPEQARGEAVDHRADLFSLGSVLYAMCTGQPPFRASSALGMLRQVSDETPIPVRSLNPETPAWLEAVVARLMQKNPEDRFQQAAEIGTLLADYLAHLRQPNVPAPRLPAAPRPKGRRSAGLWLVLAGMALALGVAVSSYDDVLLPTAPQVKRPVGRRPDLSPPAAIHQAPAAPDAQAQAPGVKEQPQPLAFEEPPEVTQAIAMIARFGGQFKRDERLPDKPIIQVSFYHAADKGAVTDDDIALLVALPKIRIVNFQGTKMTDTAMKTIARFKDLKEAFLGQTRLGDAGIEELANLERLTHIGVEDTQVSDVGIQKLAGLKNLIYLNIGGTRITDGCFKEVGGFVKLRMLCAYRADVTDVGIKQLKGLLELEKLLIFDTAVTDTGMKELGGLQRLKEINAERTGVTAAGLKQMKEKMPAVNIVTDDVARPLEPRGRGWLMAAFAVCGVIALSVAGAVFVARKRRGDDKKPSIGASSKRNGAPPAGAGLSLTCPGCQTKLKAKAEQAGKTVKCPNCGMGLEAPLIAGVPPK
jgi:serine/threonine protein kinase